MLGERFITSTVDEGSRKDGVGRRSQVGPASANPADSHPAASSARGQRLVRRSAPTVRWRNKPGSQTADHAELSDARRRAIHSKG